MTMRRHAERKGIVAERFALRRSHKRVRPQYPVETAHLEHVADLCRLALALAAPGIFMLVENGSVLDWIAREPPASPKGESNWPP